MKFDEWLDEIEGFAFRMERIYDDLVRCPKDPVDNWKQIKSWLEAAYNVGYEEGIKKPVRNNNDKRTNIN